MFAYSLLVAVILAGSATAFRAPVSSRCHISKCSLAMSNNKATPSITTGLLALFSSIAIMNSPMPVMAANYGGFGSTYSEVINPKDSVLNDETAGSENVKSGLASLTEFKETIKTIRADLAKDKQTELSQRLKKELVPSKIRLALNKYNEAFSEDTQRGTDRLIRNIIQDLTELDREAIVKPGKQRSDVKVKAVEKRLGAAADALDQLSAFIVK